MTARLRTSIEAAEGLLSDEAQDRLALIVQSFTATEGELICSRQYALRRSKRRAASRYRAPADQKL